MVNFDSKDNYGFEDLVKIMNILRSENGCPWDREQTHVSLRADMLEEAYEAADAIDSGDKQALCEELGDVLLQSVFHAQIEKETGGFDIGDVTDGICRKLIRRHPHIFGDTHVDGSADVLRNWDAIKKTEHGDACAADALKGVAHALPALTRARKVQSRARKSGYDWPDVTGALEKVTEETEEVKSALSGDGNTEDELGDLLFAVVNVCRFADTDPEFALTRATDKFISRFAAAEKLIAADGKTMENMSLSELDVYWAAVKNGKEV